MRSFARRPASPAAASNAEPLRAPRAASPIHAVGVQPVNARHDIRHVPLAPAAAASAQAGLTYPGPVAIHKRPDARQTDPSYGPPLQAYPARPGSPPAPALPTPMPNPAGLPTPLRAGVEALSGFAMDRVRVHYNSPEPAQLNAQAYAQGSDIHLAPGRQGHLAHEAWHLVQQAQGRVSPTTRMAGRPVSVDRGLEAEADLMSARALAAGRAGSFAAPPARVMPGSAGLDEPIQCKPDNEAYRALMGHQPLELTTENYLNFLEESTEKDRPIAYIVNAILPYSQIDQIPKVVAAVLTGLSKEVAQRVGFVFGVNAHKGKKEELDAALLTAQAIIDTLEVPVGIVGSTFGKATFPYGEMRNAVMHSEENRQLIAAFVARGYHPYLSVQDFDIGSRITPSGKHVFDYFNDRLSEQPDEDIEEPLPATRPLLFVGGYRPGDREPLLKETALRLERSRSAPAKTKKTTKKKARTEPDQEMLVDELEATKIEKKKSTRKKKPAKTEPDQGMLADESEATIRRKEAAKRQRDAANQEKAVAKRKQEDLAMTSEKEMQAFYEDLHGEVHEDMHQRDELAKIHPLLPYAPEPNLFIDSLPILIKAAINFGGSAAEYTQLGKDANRFLGQELEEYFKKKYPDAPEPREVVKTTPSKDVKFSLDAISENPNEGEFASYELAAMETDKDEISELLKIHAQTGRHPLRGQAFLTDFVGGSIETDLSRLAVDYLRKGVLPQSHTSLTPVVDRFHQEKKGKTGVSYSKYRDSYRKPEHKRWEPLLPIFHKPDEIIKPAQKQISNADQKFLEAEGKGVTSSAISSKMASKTFGNIVFGIQPEHKLVAAHSTALADPLHRLYQLLSLLLNSSGGTPLDGNCLYHAVNQALNQGASPQGATELRQRVVTWAMNDANLQNVALFAQQHGVDFIDLINTIQRNGNWGGRAGDLAPRMVASAIGRTIEIVRPNSGQDPVVVPPLGQEAAPEAQRIIIYLHADHYSINPTGI